MTRGLIPAALGAALLALSTVLPPPLPGARPAGRPVAIPADLPAARPAGVLVPGAGGRAEEPLERRTPLPTGVTLRSVERGDPAGRAVLYLHGYTDSSASAAAMIERLCALRPGLRVVAVDQRGHGGSSLPSAEGCAGAPERCFEVADLAADAAALLDALAIERADVVGHSMGSLVAQELALSRPDRVRTIVLIGATACTASNPLVGEMLVEGLVEGPWKRAVLERGGRWPADAWELLPRDVDPDVEAWMAESWAVEPGVAPEVLAAIVPAPASTPLGAWIGALRAMGSFDARDRLAELRAPALVLWGTQDPFFPEEPDQRELRAALGRAHRAHGTPWAWKAYGRRPLPGAPGAPLDDVSHNLHWGSPELVARDLAAFLDGGAPTADLAWIDPAHPERIAIEPGAARVLGPLVEDGASERGVPRTAR